MPAVEHGKRVHPLRNGSAPIPAARRAPGSPGGIAVHAPPLSAGGEHTETTTSDIVVARRARRESASACRASAMRSPHAFSHVEHQAAAGHAKSRVKRDRRGSPSSKARTRMCEIVDRRLGIGAGHGDPDHFDAGLTRLTAPAPACARRGDMPSDRALDDASGATRDCGLLMAIAETVQRYSRTKRPCPSLCPVLRARRSAKLPSLE